MNQPFWVFTISGHPYLATNPSCVVGATLAVVVGRGHRCSHSLDPNLAKQKIQVSGCCCSWQSKTIQLSETIYITHIQHRVMQHHSWHLPDFPSIFHSNPWHSPCRPWLHWWSSLPDWPAWRRHPSRPCRELLHWPPRPAEKWLKRRET